MKLYEIQPVCVCVCVGVGGASKTWDANRQTGNDEANRISAVVCTKVPDIRRADPITAGKQSQDEWSVIFVITRGSVKDVKLLW